MKRILRNIMFMVIISLISLAITICALEIYLRIFTHPLATPGYIETHPERRYALKPNFVGRTYTAEFKINSMGLRDYERPILDGVYRIAVFGDSITFGSGIELEKTFPKVMEAVLNKDYGAKIPVQVLNFGVPSYNTVMEYRYMRESYDSFRPHMIIVEFTAPNDTVMVTDLTSDINRLSIVRRVKDMLRNLYSYDFLATRFYKFLYKLRTRKYKDEHEALASKNNLYYKEDYAGWIEAKKTFSDIKHFSDDNDIVLIFAIFANNHKLSKLPERDLSYPIIKKTIAALKNAGIEHIIVIDDALRQYAGREELLRILPTDRHFSELAHALVAEEISQYIHRNNFIR